MSNKLKAIPLSQLKRSTANIRKTDRNSEIEQLAASIAANGLLENLVVKPCDGKSTKAADYEVVAGGRRLAALKLLAKRKKLDREHAVPCLILTNGTSATEASLAENFVRMPAHPADQFEAFAHLVRKGASSEDVAARFGVAPAFVEQRLKLAMVSPRLIAEYRAGAMTLEQLTAFTLSEDHAAQEEVWFDRAYADMPAHIIRRLLTQTRVEGSDPRARFVGAQAYEAAGGVIIRDLFDAEDEGYYSDSQLLDRLVAEKLTQQANALLAEGWQWVEIQADATLAQLSRFGRAAPVAQELSEPEELQLRELSERYDELVSSLEEDDDGASEELDRLSAEIETLEQKEMVWPAEEKARSGAILCLGPDGAPQVFRGLLKPEEVKRTGSNGHAAAAHKVRRSGYPDSLLLDLSAHRTAALRALVAEQPDVALIAIVHALADGLLYHGAPSSCLSVSASEVELNRASSSVAAGKAGQLFQARHEAWVARLPAPEELWSWIANLDPVERMALLAHCVALTVNALEGNGQGSHAAERAAALAQAVDLDMRAWWRPTSAEFLAKLTKNDILAAVSEGVSQQAAWRLAGFKKERMAKEAEKVLMESCWLPPSLRSLGAKSQISP